MFLVDEWKLLVRNHQLRLSPVIDLHLAWRTRGLRHPVYDFLFDYYMFSPNKLLRWSPGINVRLESDEQQQICWQDYYRAEEGFFLLNTSRFPAQRIPFLRWAIEFLQATAERSPVFHCFGLHEWAMVYKNTERRHLQVSLRVSDAEIKQVVEIHPLRCTHYDAYRFFSTAAKPLNRFQLSRDTVIENDQPGCIHANMDLYRLGYKIAPFISSELLADLFFLARDAREVDMRASPYDLTGYELSPIPIETALGREMYVSEQRRLSELAKPYRLKLLGVYRELLQHL